MSKQKQKGTAAETAVVRYMKQFGWNVERRALTGSADMGDITGTPVVIEVKNHKIMNLAEWVDEAIVEAKNAMVAVGVVWHKRRGKGSPGDWYVTMTGHAFLTLLDAAEAADGDDIG